jgi:hypothetical protein
MVQRVQRVQRVLRDLLVWMEIDTIPKPHLDYQ